MSVHLNQKIKNDNVMAAEFLKKNISSIAIEEILVSHIMNVVRVIDVYGILMIQCIVVETPTRN